MGAHTRQLPVPDWMQFLRRANEDGKRIRFYDHKPEGLPPTGEIWFYWHVQEYQGKHARP